MDDEKFFAWLDGELPVDEAAEVARLVAGDPALAAKAEAHRVMEARLASAFAPIADQPFELQGAQVVELAQQRARKGGLSAVAQWGAMAATLLIGIVTGTLINSQDSRNVVDRDGVLIASNDLGAALETQLASVPVSSGPRVGLTFRDQTGSICRTFTNSRAQGIACRDGSDWRLRTVVQAADEPSGDYRMASGLDPALGASLSSIMSGEPFDASQEKAALEDGWR